jgi:DNA mismatch endonuclease (patch repair protein)
MTDTVNKSKRAWMMSRVRSKNTHPEIVVRSFLHNLGFRFRLHSSALPGRPDIVLRRFKTVVFVNGCFWHHHGRCGRARIPSSNSQFWTTKITRNVTRDRRNIRELRRLGWNVIVVWECRTKKPEMLSRALCSLLCKREGGFQAS